MFRTTLVVIWLVVAVGATLWGRDYYLLPFQDRPFTAAHELFAPAGVVGHGYGVVGTAFMALGVVSYSIRRRVRLFTRLGKLKTWLELHIFLCTLGPFLILLHSTFRVAGLVAVAFWSMVLVVASGIFGRYLYVRIPKTLHGHFLSLEALEARRAATLRAMVGETGGREEEVHALHRRFRPSLPTGVIGALVTAARWDLSRRRRERELRVALVRLSGSTVVPEELIAHWREESRRELQIALLHPFQRLFHYWHVFHLPLSIVMFLILAVHITVAAVFGYVWIF